MQLELRLVVLVVLPHRVALPRPAVRLLVVVPPLLAVLPQLAEVQLLAVLPRVDLRVRAALPLAVHRRHDPQRADGRPPPAVRPEVLGPTRMRQRLSPAATR
ncbi:MAG TPA: hypothetical protein VIJ31_11930 [Acidothermaceae bacterium]